MTLRNPVFEQLGTAYPDNVYDITVRTILENRSDDPTVNVDITLNVYTTKTMENLAKQHKFTLYNITNDQTNLNPAAYQTALLSQHGAEIVDGTALSDFEVL